MKRLVLLKVVRNPDEYDVAVDDTNRDKITLDSGPSLLKKLLCVK
jgi:hypothetical protein